MRDPGEILARCGARGGAGRGPPDRCRHAAGRVGGVRPVASDPPVSRLVNALASSGKRALTASRRLVTSAATCPALAEDAAPDEAVR